MSNRKMKSALKLNIVLMFSLLAVSPATFASNYEEVWSEVRRSPYQRLPQYQTSYESLGRAGINYITQAANRTLSVKADLLPRFQKLVHPIGICFSGTWEITRKTPYTGQFEFGTRAPIIVRASEAMGYPNQGDIRSFGIAGKIFKGDQTANFFTMDDLGGTDSMSFLELPKTNAPDVSLHFSSLRLLPIITRIAAAFSKADSDPTFRPLYQISELGVSNPKNAKTPKWMLLRAEENNRITPISKDFRNELRLRNFSAGNLRLAIYVSDKGDTDWTKVGNINLTEDVLSDSCDHRLHFAHPRIK